MAFVVVGLADVSGVCVPQERYKSDYRYVRQNDD